MGYLKYTQYIYLAVGVFFFYDAFTKYNQGDESFWLFLGVAVMAIFMFFFRRRFIKKYDNNKRN